MRSTIKAIQKRGVLRAGVSLGINGLSYFDKEQSKWTGFDIDTARAISAALLGDADAVEFIPLQSGQRFTALQSQSIDIGVFNATLSLSREVNYGVQFMEPMLYDGEAFMIRKNVMDQAGHIRHLNSRVVSAIRGSTTYRNLELYFSKNHLNYEVILSETPDEALAQYESNKCTLYCLDRILLTGERLRLSDPDAHIILPDVISREAMSPAVSSKDPNWVRAVRWVLKAMIEAEELGISQKNIQDKKEQADQYSATFLNPDPQLCEGLGLQNNFTEKVITQVGNYADIYHRNLGDCSPLRLQRSENHLRSNGGLLFSPLFL